MKYEIDNNVTNARSLVNHMYETDSILEVFRWNSLDENQLTMLRQFVVLVTDVQHAAGELADSLNAWD